MPNLSAGINLALQAVLAHSQAIEIIEHNVANANTPGYRRQAPILTATVASPVFGYEHGYLAGQRGTGVTIDKIQRFNLEFFDGRFRAVSGESKNYEARRDILVQMESILAETSSDGLIPKMDEFWAGWQALANDPTNTALRGQLLETASGLSQSFQRRWQMLTDLRAGQNLAIADQADKINQMGQEIADLNAEISRVLSVGEQPNDLMDKRDLLLDQLAEAAGAVSHIQQNGEMIVSIGGHVLVSGRSVFQVTAQPDASGLVQLAWADGQAFNPPTGAVKGMLFARDTTIVNQINGLNQLAETLGAQVNALHSGGYGLPTTANPNGATGLNFFTFTAGNAAATLQVNSALTVADVAASSAGGQPGNSDLAVLLAGLRGAKVMNGGTASMGEFYNAQVTALGIEVQSANRNAYHNNLVRKALSDQRESVAGVNLDEEAANLVKFQRAYQAAARVLTAYDELLDRVINGMGLVGR